MVEQALVEHFGHSPARASVSFLGVEPIDVLRFAVAPGIRGYVSLGMSRRPMTAASEAVVTESGPRAELVVRVREDEGVDSGIWRRLAVLAAAPAVEGVVYQLGMTVDLGEPLVPGSRCTGGVVSESGITSIATAPGPVDVLEFVPATSTELAWCRVHGAAALWERWSHQEVDLLDLGRRAADLS